MNSNPEPLTREQASDIYESGDWATWSDYEKVRRQLFEERLMMPFRTFHKAVESVLNHSVHTFQFGDSKYLDFIKAEFLALPVPQ